MADERSNRELLTAQLRNERARALLALVGDEAAPEAIATQVAAAAEQ